MAVDAVEVHLNVLVLAVIVPCDAIERSRPDQRAPVAAPVVVRQEFFVFDFTRGRNPEKAKLARGGFAPKRDAPTLSVGGKPCGARAQVARLRQALRFFVDAVVARAIVDDAVAVVVDAVTRFDAAGEGGSTGVVTIIAAGFGSPGRVACAWSIEAIAVLIGCYGSKAALARARVAGV